MRLHEIDNSFRSITSKHPKKLNEAIGVGGNRDEKKFQKLRNEYFKRIYPAWREFYSNEVAAGTDMNDLATLQSQFNRWVQTKGFGDSVNVAELTPFQNTSEDAQKAAVMQAIARAMNAASQNQQGGTTGTGQTAQLQGDDGNIYTYVNDGSNWIEQSTNRPVIDRQVQQQLNAQAQQQQQQQQQQQTEPQPDTTATQAQQQAPQQQPETTSNSEIFTDPEEFKSAWDAYVNSKGENYQLISDPKMLKVLKDIWMEGGGTVLKETFYKSGFLLLENVTRDLTTKQRYVVENIYNSLSPLIEVSLSSEQINDIFGKVYQSVEASGTNRTKVGTTVDSTKKIASTVKTALKKAGEYVQDTTPVKAFDTKFEQLKDKIRNNIGEDSKVIKSIDALSDLAKKHPGKTAAVIGIMTLVSSLAAGPLGGAIAGQVLRGGVELVKGAKLSTAIGKGLMTAGVGYLAGMSISAIGDVLSDSVADAAIEQVTNEYGQMRWEFQGISNGKLSIQNFEFIGKNDDIEKMNDVYKNAVNAWKSGNFDKSSNLFNRLQDMIDEADTPDAVAKRIGDMERAFDIREMAEKAKELFGNLAAAAQAAAQGAISFDNSGQPEKEDGKQKLGENSVVKLFRTLDGVVLQEAIGDNVTKKITTSKLRKLWKKAGSPTDSGEIYKLLLKAGVDKKYIDDAYDVLGIESSGTEADRDEGDQNQQSHQDTSVPTDQASNGASSGATLSPESLRSQWEAHVESGGGLNPKVRGVLRDILNTVYTKVI